MKRKERHFPCQFACVGDECANAVDVSLEGRAIHILCMSNSPLRKSYVRYPLGAERNVPQNQFHDAESEVPVDMSKNSDSN
jgi:hypothetical protein